jgi:hypothetical protein
MLARRSYGTTPNKETSNGLDAPKAAGNLHRHGNQRLFRREAVDHDFVFMIGGLFSAVK